VLASRVAHLNLDYPEEMIKVSFTLSLEQNLQKVLQVLFDKQHRDQCPHWQLHHYKIKETLQRHLQSFHTYRLVFVLENIHSILTQEKYARVERHWAHY
jgi:hypothetical protein